MVLKAVKDSPHKSLLSMLTAFGSSRLPAKSSENRSTTKKKISLSEKKKSTKKIFRDQIIENKKRIIVEFTNNSTSPILDSKDTLGGLLPKLVV